MLHRTRHLFIRQQTAVINAIRAHLWPEETELRRRTMGYRGIRMRKISLQDLRPRHVAAETRLRTMGVSVTTRQLKNYRCRSYTPKIARAARRGAPFTMRSG